MVDSWTEHRVNVNQTESKKAKDTILYREWYDIPQLSDTYKMHASKFYEMNSISGLHLCGVGQKRG